MAPALSRVTMLSERLFPGPLPNARELRPFTLGGSLEEIVESERTFTSERPFVLLGQPSLFDPSRAPAGQHAAWAYCHVPNGSTKDHTESIENQIARFAPGFRDCILARSVSSPAALERWNPNLIEATSWEVSWISVRFSSVLRLRSIALPSLICICVEHRLPLGVVSTEWPATTPLRPRLGV